MSLERRVAQMRQEQAAGQSAYFVIAATLRKDSSAMFSFFQKNLRGKNGGVSAEPIDPELVDVYELKPEDIPTLSLPSNLSFLDGFSYVAGHWYQFVRIVGSGLVKPKDEHIMDSELERIFPDRGITTQVLRGALSVDPSGATWLEEQARVEFNEETLSLIGARKAISGAKRMYELLTPAAK